MSAEIINLRLARKARQRTAMRAAADENAARHGRSRAEKAAEEIEAEREKARLEGHEVEKE